jgi:pSer/pThr/pTyr-binding forkhead associated (FHA) protein
MAVTVVVRTDPREGAGGLAPSLTFDGDRIVIGRSDGCDVRLPDPSVSLRHASLRAQGSSFVLVDEGSTNGTWVGGVKLATHTPRLVRTGDLVRVGRVWLEILVGARPVTPDLGLATRDLALALVRNAMDALGDDTRAKIAVTEGPDLGAELVLLEEGKAYVVGRGAQCDLLLADEDASREHATVTRRGGQVLLRDAGSRNGVYLGESRIPTDREVPWRSPTMVRLAASVLSLHEPVSLALAQIEAAADERLADEAVPPPPSAPPPASAGAASEGAPAPAAPPAGATASGRAPEPPNAPIAPQVSRSATTIPRGPRARARRGWTGADLALVTVAILMIGVSVAGLVWVLR